MKNVLLPALFCLTFISCKRSTTKNPGPPEPPPAENDLRFNINTSLVTPNASKEAVALYNFLREQYGKKIISGVMTLASFDESNWLKTNAGKKPAILGLDFMHCNRNYAWYNAHNSLDLWKKILVSGYVITLDEMPSLR